MKQPETYALHQIQRSSNSSSNYYEGQSLWKAKEQSSHRNRLTPLLPERHLVKPAIKDSNDTTYQEAQHSSLCKFSVKVGRYDRVLECSD